MSQVLTPDLEALVAVARAAKVNAYAPYSGFRVVAALRTTEGTIYRGVNMENAAFPVGVCAEVSALCAAITGGSRDVEAIAIVTDGDRPVMPCGMCRQAIFELNPEATVVVAGETGPTLVVPLASLLPYGFGPADLPPRKL